MNEQLINFKTAKLAKEVGFNWLCLYHYHKEKLYPNWIENGSSTDVEFEADVEDLLEDYNNKNLIGSYCSVPTQAMLQKWLRDIHGIAVHISTDITLSWTYTIQSLHPQATYTGSTITSGEVFNTYEEALEKGLHEALKLIKNERDTGKL